MTNPKHTPGPWKVVRDGRGQPLIVGPEAIDPVTEARYHFVGTLSSVPTTTYLRGKRRETGGEIEQEANARLIAAAPNLLAALEGLEFLAVLRAPSGVDQEAWDTAFGRIRTAIAKAKGGA